MLVCVLYVHADYTMKGREDSVTLIDARSDSGVKKDKKPSAPVRIIVNGSFYATYIFVAYIAARLLSQTAMLFGSLRLLSQTATEVRGILKTLRL